MAGLASHFLEIESRYVSGYLRLPVRSIREVCRQTMMRRVKPLCETCPLAAACAKEDRLRRHARD